MNELSRIQQSVDLEEIKLELSSLYKKMPVKNNLKSEEKRNKNVQEEIKSSTKLMENQDETTVKISTWNDAELLMQMMIGNNPQSMEEKKRRKKKICFNEFYIVTLIS